MCILISSCMDVKKAILERKSIRKYKKDVPSHDEIMEVLDAARLAPSGTNAQPCRYKIIKDDKTKKKLKEDGIAKQGFVYDAPVLIVCCADPSVYKKTALDSDNEVRAIRDLSIASSFLVLRAAELGLGTCYIGWIEKEKIKQTLGIPNNFVVPFIITLGYPDEIKEATLKKPLDEIIF